MLYLIASVLGFGGAAYLGIKFFAPWLLDDINFVRKFKRTNDPFMKYVKEKKFLIDIFESMASERPEKAMILYEEESYTFRDVEERANQCGHAFLEQGFKPGEVVALMMQNEPAFIWIYFGLLKIGVQTAFINFNQRHKTLIHSIKICDAQYLIVGDDPDLDNAVKEIKTEINHVRILTYTSAERIPGALPMLPLLEKASIGPIVKSYRAGIEFKDAGVYIFTSGTTGNDEGMVFDARVATEGGIECIHHQMTCCGLSRTIVGTSYYMHSSPFRKLIQGPSLI